MECGDGGGNAENLGENAWNQGGNAGNRSRNARNQTGNAGNRSGNAGSITEIEKTEWKFIKLNSLFLLNLTKRKKSKLEFLSDVNSCFIKLEM